MSRRIRQMPTAVVIVALALIAWGALAGFVAGAPNPAGEALPAAAASPATRAGSDVSVIYLPLIKSGFTELATGAATPTLAATGTATASPSATPTATRTATPTLAATGTATGSPSATPTATRTATPTLAATGTATGSPSATPTATRTATPTLAATGTATGSPSATPTATRTATPTLAATGAATASPSATPTATRTATATPVDTTEPDTFLISGPPPQAYGSSAIFEFYGSDPESGIAGFDCQVDNTPWLVCNYSPVIWFGLNVGPHRFYVRARNNAGLVDHSPSTWDWTTVATPTPTRTPSRTPTRTATPVDVTAPDTTITSGPASTTFTSLASFQFSGSDSGSGVSHFMCQLDSQAVTVCTSPAAYNVTVGAHQFRVWAVDKAGNIDPTPALWAWTRVL
jgi:hypothetical protein